MNDPKNYRQIFLPPIQVVASSALPWYQRWYYATRDFVLRRKPVSWDDLLAMNRRKYLLEKTAELDAGGVLRVLPAVLDELERNETKKPQRTDS